MDACGSSLSLVNGQRRTKDIMLKPWNRAEKWTSYVEVFEQAFKHDREVHGNATFDWDEFAA
jgi:hypothetical protein